MVYGGMDFIPMLSAWCTRRARTAEILARLNKQERDAEFCPVPIEVCALACWSRVVCLLVALCMCSVGLLRQQPTVGVAEYKSIVGAAEQTILLLGEALSSHPGQVAAKVARLGPLVVCWVLYLGPCPWHTMSHSQRTKLLAWPSHLALYALSPASLHLRCSQQPQQARTPIPLRLPTLQLLTISTTIVVKYDVDLNQDGVLNFEEACDKALARADVLMKEAFDRLGMSVITVSAHVRCPCLVRCYLVRAPCSSWLHALT